MDLREALQAIYDQHGQLTPSLVVQVARENSSEAAAVIRCRLEWDDAVAGEAWRREQAHELIRSVRVVYRKATDKAPEKSIRAFHAVRGDSGHVYEPVERVVDDPFTRRLVLADMEREWKQMKARWADFKEFAEMVREDMAQAA